MAIGRAGRSLMGPLLIVNFVVYLISLGLAGWSLDKYINGQQNHPHLGGNEATSFMLAFALLGGVVGACSVLAALMHLRAWSIVYPVHLLLQLFHGLLQLLFLDLYARRSQWEDTEERDW